MQVCFTPMMPVHKVVEADGRFAVRVVIYSIEKEDGAIAGSPFLHEGVHAAQQRSVQIREAFVFTGESKGPVLDYRE